MLLNYIAQNYKSIGHRIEFNMFTAEKNVDERFLTTIKTKAGTWDVLRRGVLFGANASGKTSFIESVAFARNYILKGIKSGKRTRINKFKAELDDIGGNSLFQFQFYFKEEVYEYGFALDDQRVFEEWLMILTVNGFEPMFQRRTGNDSVTDIDMEGLLRTLDEKDGNLAETLTASMKENQKNQLFLYKLADNGIKKAEEIMQWFESMQFIFPYTKFRLLELRLKNKKLSDFLGEKLRNYDTGINRIFIAPKKVKLSEMLKSEDIPQDIIDDIENNKSGIVEIAGKIFVFEGENGEPIFYELKLEHILNSKEYNFARQDESDGTKRLLDLLPLLFGIENNSLIYFVDEIDRSLHTKLTQNFIKTFAENTEDSLSQLIFTAHDVNLIDLNEMRQDEIWFVDKNKLGETSIRPFSYYEISKGYDAINAYLVGRFGAVPHIKKAVRSVDAEVQA